MIFMKTITQGLVNYVFSIKNLQRWMPICLILFLAGSCYLYNLGHESLWIDELISIDRSKSENLNLFRTRPLYYLVLHIWMKFGSSDAWLRALNILFSLGSILLIYQLGRRLIGESVGLSAALISTLSPLLMNHAQEVRMYAPSVFFGLLGSSLLVEALENPRVVLIVAWSLVRFLAILTLPLNLLLLLPDTVLFTWKFRKYPRILYRFGLGLLLIGIAWLPWIIQVASNSADFMGGVKVPGAEIGIIKSQRSNPDLFSVVFQFARFTAWPFGRPNSNLIDWFYKAYSLILFCLLALSVVLKRLRSSQLSWIAAWSFLPLIPLFLVSQISRSLWVDRYLLLTVPYVFILLAACFLEVWHRQRWGALTVALVYLIAVGGGIKRYYTVDDREDWRGLVAMVSQDEREGDLLVWSMNQSIPRALNHYYHGSADIEIVPYGHQHEMERDNEVLAAENWLSNLPEQRDRIWLAYSGTSSVFLAALEERFEVQKHKTFSGGLDVFLLTPN